MTKTDVTTKENTEMELTDEMFGDDVLGYSDDQDDSLIPILSILQDNSGEVKKKHERHIEGAEAGRFIIRSLGQVYNGEDEGLIFQPCGFSHTWVEWEGDPGEGRPVNQYEYVKGEVPGDAKEIEKPDGGKEWRLSNGNRLVETRNHFGFVLLDDGWIPTVVPMSGSNHQASRKWTLLMKQQRLGDGRRAAAFMRLYRLTTSFSQKGQQTWYKYKIALDEQMPEKDQIMAGFNLAKSVASNEVTADIASDTETSADAPVAPDDELPI